MVGLTVHQRSVAICTFDLYLVLANRLEMAEAEVGKLEDDIIPRRTFAIDN
jgi:hypothetical protein